MNAQFTASWRRTNLLWNNQPYEIFEKIGEKGEWEYSLRGPLGTDGDNKELLKKLLKWLKNREKKSYKEESIQSL